VVNISDKVSLIPSFYFRQLIGENVVFSKLSSFGGFQKTYIESYLPFPGYDFMQIEGHTAIFPSFDLRYSFWNHHYFCLKTNFLSIDLDLDKGIDKNDFYFGAVLSYSYSSPFGPISLSMAKAYPLNKYVFDLSLGFWF
jgi:NTE family protein